MKVIMHEEWEREMDRVSIKKEDVDRVVMNFFMTYGYLEVADMFNKESLTKPQIDISDGTVYERGAVNKDLLRGKVANAIEQLNEMNPEILNTNPELSFHLQNQILIELIRDGKEDEALAFAKGKLKQLAQGNEAFMTELNDSTFLLCANEPLDVLNRFKVAIEANAAILASQGREKDSILQSLSKMLVWTQNELDEEVVYPRIHDLSTARIEHSDESTNDLLCDELMTDEEMTAESNELSDGRK